ncbi:MAG: chemotaxis protein CheA [Candidatus Cloacimonetes bacterium]|nr:chemotaxis protein CheA [Candidatus Cloacimonadota bacterium]
MYSEEFYEKVESLSVSLIDLDEKDYTELAGLLSVFEKVREEIKNTTEDTAMIEPINAMCESIEKLILRDIDPIADIDAVHDSIHVNFESFKKLVLLTNKPKPSMVDTTSTVSEDGQTEAESITSSSIETIPELDDIEVEEEILEETAEEKIASTSVSTENKIETDTSTPVVESKKEPPPQPKQEPVILPPSPDVFETDHADDELFMDFINEAKEYVYSLENNMLELEEQPGNLNLINEIFRPFHTLKGVSGFMGLGKINHISHEAENILDKARNSKLDITPNICSLIFKTIDLIKKIISELNVSNRVENISDAELTNIVSLLQAAASGQDIPDVQALTPASQENKEQETPKQVEKEVMSESVEEKSNISEPTEAVAEKETPPTRSFPTALDVVDHEPPAVQDAINLDPAKAKTVEESVRVKTEKLDFLIEMVGELVISYNLFDQDKNILNIFDHEFLKKKSQLHRVISDLQKASMALRMIPIGQTFTKMKRVIRDYSTQHKKAIDLVLLGEETEIDRNMVDSLNEPLVHMIRNSCDHGIENADVRQQKGKPIRGTITLSAYHKGNSIIIEVKDDGKGLDKDKILKKAIEKKLVPEHAQLTDSEIFKLVFLPGFSTMEVVSNVSGRGVGMDVVMQAITQLGGNVEIISEQDKGSIFRISLPLTLAIIAGMLVEVSGELYIIPIANIRRSLKPSPEILNSVMNKAETVKVENNLIPIVRLNRKFNFTPKSENLEDSRLIILETTEKQYAIAVDELIGIKNVVVKSLGEKFKDLDGISGATIMGDGKVGLILDVSKLDVER